MAHPRQWPQLQLGRLSVLRPELINRLDAVVPFVNLSPEIVRQVAQREMRELEKRPGLKR